MAAGHRHAFISLSPEQIAAIVGIIGCKKGREGYSIPDTWRIYRIPTTGNDPHYLELRYKGRRWVITDRPGRQHRKELMVIPTARPNVRAE